MRSIALTGPKTFERQDRPRPTVTDDDVLVRMGYVGICGSDVHYYRHGRIGDYVVEEPLVLGHESAGEVVEVGDGVVDLAPGDRVALEPGVPCRTCEHCRRGEYNLCPEVTFMATPPDDGAFAEYVAWPVDFAYKLPPRVSTREGALCEPLSVGIHACRRGEVGVGDTVLITGAGPIGMLTMEAVRRAGASRVIVSDVVPAKLDRASARGADRVVDATESDVAETVAAATDGTGVDVVIEASGAAPAVGSALSAVRRGGIVVCIGLTSEEAVPIDMNAVVDNELDLRGSFRFRNTYDRAISLLANDDVNVAGIVDFELSLSSLDEAFERAQDPTVVKGVIAVDD